MTERVDAHVGQERVGVLFMPRPRAVPRQQGLVQASAEARVSACVCLDACVHVVVFDVDLCVCVCV